jgi:hypothetical protein
MYGDNWNRFLTVFIRVFTVLLIITIVLPWALEQLMSLIIGSLSPGADSIKVFKDFISERATVSRFLGVLKKIIIFM